jgi:flagellar motor component MotA
LSSKVKEKALAEETLLDLTIEGLLAVHAGEHPLKIEERLAGLSVYTPNETVVVAATPAWQTVKTR